MADGLRRQEEHELAFIEAIERPPRGDILMILSDRVAGAREIAEELDEPIGKVRRHLRALLAAGLIETEGTKTRRGAIEKYFLLASRGFLSDERFAELSPDMRRQIANFFLKAIVVDLGRAVRTETTHDQRQPMAVRIRLELDLDGWRELNEICLETLAEVEDLRNRAYSRLEGRDAETIPVSLGILALELSSRSSGDLPRARRQESSSASRMGGASTRQEEQAFVAALEDPTRAGVLHILTDRVAGVREIAEKLGRPLDEIRDHLRALLASDLITVERSESRRGVPEQYLVIDSRLAVGDELFAELSPDSRRRVLNHYLKMIAADIGSTIRSGATYRPHGPLTLRVRMALENRDWPALERIVGEATARMEDLKHRVAERLDEQGGEAIPVSAAMTALELGSPSLGEVPKQLD